MTICLSFKKSNEIVKYMLSLHIFLGGIFTNRFLLDITLNFLQIICYAINKKASQYFCFLKDIERTANEKKDRIPCCI